MKTTNRKITIYTLNGYVNYGNRLQLYALFTVLKSYGFIVRVYWRKRISRAIKEYVKMMIPIKEKYRTEKKIKRFSDEYAPKITRSQFGDWAIFGSDQIWNPNYIVQNEALLGEGNDCVKVSYAASLGVDKLDSEYGKRYSNALKEFRALSVRERTAKTVLEALLGRQIDVVLDPTLLIDEKKYAALEKKPKDIVNGEKYIVSYILGDKECAKRAKEYALKKHLKVIEFSDRRDSNYGIEEFLYIIHHAELICTDSFHACVFSLIFERPFLAFKRTGEADYMYTRLQNLMDTFKLKSREYGGGEITDKSLSVDYSESKEILKNERKKSLDYLKRALDIRDEK